MTEMATEPVTYSRKPMDTINRKILSMLKVPFPIPQALRTMLLSAAEAFMAKSYKTSAKYFKNALDSLSEIDEKAQDFETIMLTKYMLCRCWLESTDAKDLIDASKILEELEISYGYAYPMLYFAVGTAYFKLYRFAKADEILKEGFAVLKGDIQVNLYRIPGTDVVIHESSRDHLMAALETLNDQCSSWHRPDAVCCMTDCSSHSQNESADKNIFFGSPTFIGMVQVSCNNTSSMCVMSFHTACWKVKKESLSSLGKLSDKDVLHWECFTPNCEDQGVRCTIRKIEIFDEKMKVKATIESRSDEIARHVKVQPTALPPPKGAIRKQHHSHQPKTKVTTNQSRPPPDRTPRPPTIQHDAQKIDEADDDDGLHDEQALRSGIEKLNELRAKNFGINDEKIWRPNLPMYGNQFMLATAENQPDPDFQDEGMVEAELKAFFFSYFYTFILKSGPVKLEALNEKWNEAKNMIEDCETILKHYCDIADFLLQSVKFAVIGEYICVAEKLPEAYDLAKTHACEFLRFFVENDIDQRSNSSSDHDDYNDTPNPEKNNNSLPYLVTSRDSRDEDKRVVRTELANSDKTTNGSNPSKIGLALQSEKKSIPEFECDSQSNGHAPRLGHSNSKPSATYELEQKKPHDPIHMPAPTTTSSPTNSSSQKRSYPLESANGQVFNPIDARLPVASSENSKNGESHPRAMNGIDHVREIPTPTSVVTDKSKVSAQKLTKQSKSANDIIGSKTTAKKDYRPAMSHTEEPNKQANPPVPPSTSARSILESENDAILVKELRLEVQRLMNKSAVSEYRMAHLESQVQTMKEAHVADRVRLSQKILQYQHVFNQSQFTRRSDECRKSYDLITGIQTILMSTTGSILPINGAEYENTITEIEKLSKKHQEKWREHMNKLNAVKTLDDTYEFDLQLDPIPNGPAIELSTVIQNAFNIVQHQQPGRGHMSRNLPMFASSQNPTHYFNHTSARPAYPLDFNPNVLPPGNVRIPSKPFVAPPPQNNIGVPQRPPRLSQKIPSLMSQPMSPARLQPSLFAVAQTSTSTSAQQSTFLLGNQSLPTSVHPSSWHPQLSTVTSEHSNILGPETLKSCSPTLQSYQYSEEPKNFVSNQRGTVLPPGTSLVHFPPQQCESSNDRSTPQRRISPVSSSSNNGTPDPFEMHSDENATSHDTYLNPMAGPKETRSQTKKKYQSMDKLMSIMRTRYVGVLELDILKSIESVRANHNNSLSRIPINQIVREARRYVMDRQQKQLCGYGKRPTQLPAALNSSAWYTMEGDRKPETSTSSASSANSVKKEILGSMGSKKKWEPVVIPNDNWQKESPESECAICLQTMIHSAEAYTLQCKHTFHKSCIKHWHSHSQSCPTCRVHSTIDDEYPPLPLG